MVENFSLTKHGNSSTTIAVVTQLTGICWFVFEKKSQYELFYEYRKFPFLTILVNVRETFRESDDDPRPPGDLSSYAKRLLKKNFVAF